MLVATSPLAAGPLPATKLIKESAALLPRPARSNSDALSELYPGSTRYKKIIIGWRTMAAVRHATLESDSAMPSSAVAKIIKEISVDVPPPRPRRSKILLKKVFKLTAT
ncbi:unnamed protein product, partial [Iphiclides podalirius]